MNDRETNAEPLKDVALSDIERLDTETATIAIADESQELMTQEGYGKLEEWRESAKERPLRVLVCGLGGVGKTTLINRLLKLQSVTEAVEVPTSIVSKYESTTESGINVCLFDTPGFDDVDLSREEIIAMMEKETEGKLDIVFYCISLDGPARLQQSDAEALKIMTQAFSSDIWKKAVIVLTCANILEEKVSHVDEYTKIITNIKEKVKYVLRKEALVREEIIAGLPIVSAGYTDQMLKYEAEECNSSGGWVNRLFIEALKQVDPALFPALFQVHLSWTDFMSSLGSKAAIVTGIGTSVGAIIGAVISPFSGLTGAGIGAVLGGGIAVSIGAVAGRSGLGTLSFELHKLRSILRIKYLTWRMKPPKSNIY